MTDFPQDEPVREYCCPECFVHKTLRSIVEDESDDEGECDFCGSENVPLVHVSVLYDALHNAVRMYRPAEAGVAVAPWDDAWEEGEPLYTTIDEDWHVFSEGIAASDTAVELLRAILESGWDDDSGEALPDPYELVVSRPSWVHQTPAEDWRDFCYAILHDESVDHYLPESLEEDIHILGRDISQQVLFRAQRGFGVGEFGSKVPYVGRRIGAPPPDKIKPGRANKRCEVVLYAAERPETAVAEVRPARGLLVSVGELEIKQPIRILDLLHVPPTIDPFTSEDFEYWIDFWGLMREFSRSLSTPLERDDQPEVDYRPSQWLCKWFRDRGFQGIRYPSALHTDGVNIVLFDPTRAGFRQSSLVRVDAVEWSFSEYDPDDDDA
jgi:hypothetical protein